MTRFTSYDGTQLAYRTVGQGPPLVCVPGGPGQAVEYLGDLGGLSEHRTLIMLDNRGTGDSEAPRDPESYRVDRLVADVEALRVHLGLSRMDLFGHSASGGTCMLYAAEHPDRLNALVLCGPSLRVTGLPSDLGVEAVLKLRSGEPWYESSLHALTAEPTTPEELVRYRYEATAFLFGQWNEATKAYARAEPDQFAEDAKEGFYRGFSPDLAVPAALGALAAPVLLVTGEVDIWPTVMAVHEFAKVFANAQVTVQAGAGHFPWIDDPARFALTVNAFLSE